MKLVKHANFDFSEFIECDCECKSGHLFYQLELMHWFRSIKCL